VKRYYKKVLEENDGEKGDYGGKIHHSRSKRYNPSDITQDRLGYPYQELEERVVRVRGEPGCKCPDDNEPGIQAEDHIQHFTQCDDKISQYEH
jgi:hypothetical protein